MVSYVAFHRKYRRSPLHCRAGHRRVLGIESHLLAYDRRRRHSVRGVYTRLIAGHVYNTYKELERYALAA